MLRTFLFLFFLFYTVLTSAHVINESYLFLAPTEQGFDVRWQTEEFFYEKHLSLDHDGNELISFDDLYYYQDKVIEYSMARIDFLRGKQTCRKTKPVYSVTSKDIDTYVQMDFKVRCPQSDFLPIKLKYQLFFDVDPLHKVFVRWQTKNEKLLMIDRHIAQKPVDLTRPSLWQAFLSFIVQGIEHIWTGIDHLFFVLLLVIPAPFITHKKQSGSRLKGSLHALLIVITSFTIAHSITLAISVLHWVNISPNIIEPLIALSIVLTAVNNYFGWIRQYWLGAFVFGLLHGFGFAYLLLDMDLPTAILGLGLLGFNLGVELGQLMFVLIVFPFCFALSKNQQQYQKNIVRNFSAILGMIAFYWMLQRIGLI